MEVRGAPLIGATAAYGIVLALIKDNDQSYVEQTCKIDKLKTYCNQFKMGN